MIKYATKRQESAKIAGEFIELFDTEEEARAAIARYEKEDKRLGRYKDNGYIVRGCIGFDRPKNDPSKRYPDYPPETETPHPFLRALFHDDINDPVSAPHPFLRALFQSVLCYAGILAFGTILCLICKGKFPWQL